jgi:hypothetical protein
MSIQLQGNNDSSFSNDINIKGIVQGSGFRTDGNNGQITANYNLVTESTDQALGLFIGCSDSLNATKENSKATIAGNGSASFSGEILSGQSPYSGANVGTAIDNGGIACTKTNGGDALWAGYKKDDGSTTSRINADGSASFGGGIKTQGGIFRDGNVNCGAMLYATATGSIVGPCDGTGSSRPDSVNLGDPANRWKALYATNTFFSLDTGGTLDVKDRLQNTRAILLRLKAALIQPDADVNTLRARLLEAFDILTLEGDEE